MGDGMDENHTFLDMRKYGSAVKYPTGGAVGCWLAFFLLSSTDIIYEDINMNQWQKCRVEIHQIFLILFSVTS